MGILQTLGITGKSSIQQAAEAKGSSLQKGTIPLGGGIIKAANAITSVGKATLTLGIAGGAALVGYGAVKENPKGVIKAPYNLADYGIDLGKTLANPSKENAMSLIEEHPLASAATAAAAALALGKGTIAAVASYNQTQAIKEQTEAIRATAEAIPQGVQAFTTPQQSLTPLPSASSLPASVTPATQSISTPRRKRKASKKTGNINQSVKINIVNQGLRVQNKKYLNVAHLVTA